MRQKRTASANVGFQRCLLGCAHARPRRPQGMRVSCSFCYEWHSGSAWCWCCCPAATAQRSPSVQRRWRRRTPSRRPPRPSADLRGFCSRQPDACTVGSQVATAIGYKAQAGAKMLYEVLTEALAPRETGSVANGTTRGGRSAKSASEKSSARTGLAKHPDPGRSHARLARSGRRARTASTPHSPTPCAPRRGQRAARMTRSAAQQWRQREHRPRPARRSI